MDDLISRQAVIDEWKNDFREYINALDIPKDDYKSIMEYIDELPSTQPEDWMERNKERILQAGMEGREIEFRIGGRLFAIREKAQ